MEIFINTQGTATKLSPQHVYQGTNVSQINLYAPFPSQTSLSVAFMLPDGTTTPYYPMTFTGITSDEAEGINLWQYVMPFAITQDAGAARVAFLATFNENGTAAQQTSAYVDFTIEQSALPALPDEPTPDVWTQILSYLSAQDTKIAAIQSDVADIEQVADEANTNADAALTTANEANTTATQAKTTADNALIAANSKQDKTDNALATEQKTVVGAINENKSAIDNLRDQIVNEAHFRGFFQSSSDLPTDGVDVNDYAYIADDNSIWIYGASGWTDSGQKIPDNATKVSVGTTITGEAGTQANVTNSGTSSDVVLNFTIPRGDQGESQLVCYDVKLILGGEISVGTALLNSYTLFNRTPQVGDRFMILVYTATSTGTVTGVYLAWAQVQSVSGAAANSTVTGYQSVMGMQGEGLNVVKWYDSVEDMNADYSSADVTVGDIVGIKTSLDLYVKGSTAFESIGSLKSDSGTAFNLLRRWSSNEYDLVPSVDLNIYTLKDIEKMAIYSDVNDQPKLNISVTYDDSAGVLDILIPPAVTRDVRARGADNSGMPFVSVSIVRTFGTTVEDVRVLILNVSGKMGDYLFGEMTSSDGSGALVYAVVNLWNEEGILISIYGLGQLPTYGTNPPTVADFITESGETEVQISAFGGIRRANGF